MPCGNVFVLSFSSLKEISPINLPHSYIGCRLDGLSKVFTINVQRDFTDTIMFINLKIGRLSWIVWVGPI